MKNKPPQDLFEIMKGPEVEAAAESRAIPDSVPRGTGRKTLEQFCTEFNLDLIKAKSILKDAGLTLDEGQIFRDMAEENNLETLDLLDLLRQGFEGD